MGLNNLAVESELDDLTFRSRHCLGCPARPGGRHFQEAELQSVTEALVTDFAAQLQAYLDGRRRDFDLPLDLSFVSGDCQLRVVEALGRVFYGEGVSYGQTSGRQRLSQ